MRCPTTGIALERREAPGPSQGPPRPGTPTPLKAYGSRNLGADPADRKAGWGSDRKLPRRLPALQPLFSRGRKDMSPRGGDGMRANPGPEISKNRGSGALAEWRQGEV
jgi:hypothetical protein